MILLLLACVDPGPPPTDELALRRDVLHGLHTEVVAADYAVFVTQTAELRSAAVALCDAGGADPSDARSAWSAARAPWKRMEIVGFGPVVDEPHRYGPLIDFWPARVGVVEDLLATSDPVDAAALANLGASVRGLPVIEFLLWSPDGALQDPRRCSYLVGLTEDLAANAVGLHDAWVAYAPALEDPAAQTDFAYVDTQGVVDEWVNRMLFALSDIRAEKLGKPLGDANQGVAQPGSVESPFSDRSLQDARDLYAGIEAVFDGRDQGIGDLLLPSRTPVSFTEDFEAARQRARLALAEVPEPLASAVIDDPERVRAAQEALRDVQIVIQVDLAQALGVALSFNDNDGD